MDEPHRENPAAASADNQSVPVQLVVFELDQKLYGVEVTRVREVIQYKELTPAPGSPLSIEGVIDLREGIIPVIDLRKRFGLQCKASPESSKIMIVTNNEYIFGIIVDRVEEVFTCQISDFMPPPVAIEAGSEFIVGLTRKTDRLLLYVDVDRVLDFEKLEEETV